MIATSGELALVASRRGSRTVLDTIRQDGYLRCSRPFHDADGSARVIVSHLGPGYVRGDRFAIDGNVGDGAALCVAAQSASRSLGRDGASEATTRWHVGDGARLALFGEPLIAFDGAEHRATTTVTLGEDATFAWIDANVPYGRFVRVSSRLRVFFGDRLALHDAFVLAPERLRESVGTAGYLRRGIDPRQTARVLDGADAALARATSGRDLTGGIGSPAAGGILVRIRGARVREIRAALATVLETVGRIEAARDAPFV